MTETCEPVPAWGPCDHVRQLELLWAWRAGGGPRGESAAASRALDELRADIRENCRRECGDGSADRSLETGVVWASPELPPLNRVVRGRVGSDG
jgi:hypothetical protein